MPAMNALIWTDVGTNISKNLQSNFVSLQHVIDVILFKETHIEFEYNIQETYDVER